MCIQKDRDLLFLSRVVLWNGKKIPFDLTNIASLQSRPYIAGGRGKLPPPPEIFNVKFFYKDIEDSQTFQQHAIHEILIIFLHKRVFSGDLKRALSQNFFTPTAHPPPAENITCTALFAMLFTSKSLR